MHVNRRMKYIHFMKKITLRTFGGDDKGDMPKRKIVNY